MKRLIPILIVCLFAGCAWLRDKDQRCATYEEVYTAYRASMEVREVSAEEIAAATAAAIFLRTYCGWTSPPATADRPRGGSEPAPEADENGVPVILPPTT